MFEFAESLLDSGLPRLFSGLAEKYLETDSTRLIPCACLRLPRPRAGVAPGFSASISDRQPTPPILPFFPEPIRRLGEKGQDGGLVEMRAL